MKIRPYIKDGNKKSKVRSKFKVAEDGRSKTPEQRLEVKNANRSLKKAYRQELKRETRVETLKHLDHE